MAQASHECHNVTCGPNCVLNLASSNLQHSIHHITSKQPSIQNHYNHLTSAPLSSTNPKPPQKEEQKRTKTPPYKDKAPFPTFRPNPLTTKTTHSNPQPQTSQRSFPAIDIHTQIKKGTRKHGHRTPPLQIPNHHVLLRLLGRHRACS